MSIRHLKSLFLTLCLVLTVDCTGISIGTDSSTSAGQDPTEDPTNDGYGGAIGGSDEAGTEGNSGSSGSDSESDQTGGSTTPRSGSIFETGPIDLPITVAKLDALDPKKVTIQITGRELVITGRDGAVTSPSDLPLVYLRDNNLGEERIVQTQPSGSFETVTFSYPTGTISTSVTLAGYNGTQLGTPIFLMVDEDTYRIILTNGETLVEGATTMDEDTIYLTSEILSTNALFKTVNKFGTTNNVVSYLYALDVGGVASTVASGPISIDQVYVNAGLVMVRSGNKFYYPESNKAFTLCCEIDDAEEIQIINVEHGELRQDVIVGVATDRAAYVCSLRNMECKEMFVEIPTQQIWDILIVAMTGSDPSDDEIYLSVYVFNPGTMENIGDWHLNYEVPGGQYYTNNTGVGYWNALLDDFITGSIQDFANTGEGLGHEDRELNHFTQTYREGVLGTKFSINKPNSAITSSNASSTGDVVKVNVMEVIIDGRYDPGNSTTAYYSLDGRFNFTPSSGYRTLMEITRTRNIYDIEIHPSIYFAFFCADDENGNGQIYAFCPELIDSSGGNGYPEIIQLTHGDETCTDFKNWKVDLGSPNQSISIIDTKGSEAQARFIDPFNQPELGPCIP